MDKLITLTYYKFKIMLSDKLFFISMIIIPIFIMLATGYALRYEKLNILPVNIVDDDNSEYSKTVIQRFMAREGFKVEVCSKDVAIENLKNNKVEAVFIIKLGFQEKIKSETPSETVELAKSPQSVSVSFIGEVFASEVTRLTANNFAINQIEKEFLLSGKTYNEKYTDELTDYLNSMWSPQPLLSTLYKEINGKQQNIIKKVTIPVSTATSTGIIVVFIMFYVLFSSSWLIDERINGTLRRLISAHNALGQVFISNILALFMVGMAQLLLYAGLQKLIFNISLFTGVYSCLIFSAYLLSVISIGLLISSLLKTPAQLQAGAPVFVLFTSFVGGCFWNFVEMSPQVKQLSMLTLQGWALNGINKMMLNPETVLPAMEPVIVMLSVTAVFIPLSFAIIKRSVMN